MQTHIHYIFQDVDLFGPLLPFEHWRVILDKSPSPTVLGVLLPTGEIQKEPAIITTYLHKIRLPLLFPQLHVVNKDYQTNTLTDCLAAQQKNKHA